jgi:hypothetical protein
MIDINLLKLQMAHLLGAMDGPDPQTTSSDQDYH